ncbi:hypothetical protein GCM10017786_59010 [Amycolatopsis deserti]|uniref:AraC family transcriptional regulator n=1 Tax=Amycolatopsis deserti TaxID=185696 RepID=A0ABQ3JE41_9PSEU|nr:hypothetical protein GCM10017786_59010 [Amycolatopsis deserti]
MGLAAGGVRHATGSVGLARRSVGLAAGSVGLARGKVGFAGQGGLARERAGARELNVGASCS